MDIPIVLFIYGDGPCTLQVKEAIAEGYKLLLCPVQLETEIRLGRQEKARREAIGSSRRKFCGSF
jgi:hypothetical protein